MALTQKHLSKNQEEDYPHLKACIGKWEQADEQLKLVKGLLQNYKSRRLSKEEVSKRAQLSIQASLLEILQSGDI